MRPLGGAALRTGGSHVPGAHVSQKLLWGATGRRLSPRAPDIDTSVVIRADKRNAEMVETRNDFEVDVGTFENTVDYRIKKFSEFPDVIAQHRYPRDVLGTRCDVAQGGPAAERINNRSLQQSGP